MGARRPFLDLGERSRLPMKVTPGLSAFAVIVDNRNEFFAAAFRSSEQKMKVNPSWSSCCRKEPESYYRRPLRMKGRDRGGRDRAQGMTSGYLDEAAN